MKHPKKPSGLKRGPTKRSDRARTARTLTISVPSQAVEDAINAVVPDGGKRSAVILDAICEKFPSVLAALQESTSDDK